MDDFAHGSGEAKDTVLDDVVAARQSPSHTIQELLLPPADFPRELYVRTRYNNREGSPFLVHNPRAIALETGTILSLNSYFNSFFEAYWTQFTTVKTLTFDLTFSGALKVDIFHDSIDDGCRLVNSHIVSSSGKYVRGAKQQGRLLPERKTVEDQARPIQRRSVTLEVGDLYPVFPRPPGRYFVDITALVKSKIFKAGYSTPDLPVRSVSLSVGLCTFNREPYLTRTLQQIRAEADRTAAIKHVFVVNQGKPFETSEIREVLSDARFQLIEQANYGGCGGFTRTIVEAQNLQPAVSHHLLMDDDIILDSRVITRSIAFLNYCEKDIGLGGSMFDSIRPSVMYEGGAFLRPNNSIKPYAHNVNMADLGAPHLFHKVVNTDYNAWWYFILPVEKSREIKLPAPIFIRGDDFEYGQRLAAAGVPTVSLPGVGIWHEPFYIKPPGWQRYYDLRNRLIFGATYQNKVSKLPALEVLDMMLSRLYVHDYASFALLQKAISDYLDGPDALFSVDPATKHQQINQLNAANPVKTLTSTEAQHLRPGRVRKSVAGTVPLIGHYYLRALGLILAPSKVSTPCLYTDADAHSNSVRRQGYVMTNGPRTFFLRYEPDRAKFTKGLISALRLALRYQRNNERAMKTWNDGIGQYRELATWQPLFTPKSSS